MLRIRKSLKKVWKYLAVALFVLLMCGSYGLPRHDAVVRNYTFIPYNLGIKPGTNGDGGLSYPPGIIPNPDVKNSFLNWPLKLDTPLELGWSGDEIVNYNQSAWTVVGLVANRTVPAIVAANYSEGHIVYVTNQLAPEEELVYNILAWYFHRRNNVRVGLMIDSTNPPEQILNDWERCFSSFKQLNTISGISLNVQEQRIRQYDLNDKDLTKFNVLILAVGWGDGYVSYAWNWDNNRIHDASIREFVRNGGLLLLPEAGFSDDYGVVLPSSNFVFPPTLTLENLLSTQQNSFSMALLSLSGIGILYTIEREGRDSRLKANHGWITAFLFGATSLWIVVPMFSGVLLWQITILLWALLADLFAVFTASYVVVGLVLSSKGADDD